MTLASATRAEVGRLLGRAAFGATAEDLDRWAGRPYGELVDHLVDFPDRTKRPRALDDAQREFIEHSGKYQIDREAGFVRQAQVWWLERMRTTAYPLEERMTLFWHGHFATSVQDPFPDLGMMMAQNEMLRRHALGNFRELVAAVTLDPAMLEWLDGSRNTIPAPNENYARELLELFTLGKYPQVFTEDDVKEAARVLTGWTLDTFLRTVSFQPTLHDSGTKTVLGAALTNQGDAEYRQLIDVALGQPISPLFIAYKLVANFAYLPVSTDLLANPDPLVTRVAASLRSSNWDIRSAVRTMLLSDEFRTGDPGAGHLLVRQPAEIVVGAAKALKMSLKNDVFAERLSKMGQPILVPPNVGGWPVGTAWLSPATVLARYDWGILCQSHAGVALPASTDLEGWARLLGMPALTDVTATALRGFLAGQGKASEAARQASLLVLMLSTPDWMVM